MPHQPIHHPGAWRGTDFSGKDAIAFDFSSRQITILEDATARVQEQKLEAICQEDFPLPGLDDDLARLREEVLHGRGIVLLRGFPVEQHEPAFMARLFWGLSTHLGKAVSQSLMGDRLGHVVDVSGENPHERGYRSRKALDFHTDSDNIVAMLCLQQAREGGESLFSSALTIHNEILAEDPGLLDLLYRGFHYHWRGEEAPGEPPVTEYRIPVFSRRNEDVSVVLLRRHLEMAAETLEAPLTHRERRALDFLEEIAAREDVVLRFRLEPGEGFLINNYTVLHARTGFADGATSGQRRHLLRLWLKVPDGRQVVEAVRRFYRDDGISPREGGSTLYVHES